MRLNTQISLPKFWDYEMDFCVASLVSTEVCTSENSGFVLKKTVIFDFNLNKSFMSASVCASVWESVWDSVCVRVCESVWESVWECVWECVRVCESVWDSVCESVWECVRVCESVWECVRVCVRECRCSAICPSLLCLWTCWKYKKPKKTKITKSMFYGRLVLYIKYRFVYFILKTFLKTLLAFRHKIIIVFVSMLPVITVLHYEKHKRFALVSS